MNLTRGNSRIVVSCCTTKAETINLRQFEWQRLKEDWSSSISNTTFSREKEGIPFVASEPSKRNKQL